MSIKTFGFGTPSFRRTFSASALMARGTAASFVASAICTRVSASVETISLIKPNETMSRLNPGYFTAFSALSPPPPPVARLAVNVLAAGDLEFLAALNNTVAPDSLDRPAPMPASPAPPEPPTPARAKKPPLPPGLGDDPAPPSPLPRCLPRRHHRHGHHWPGWP